MATTISVDSETLERFNKLKREMDSNQPNVPDHNADSFLSCLMDTYEAAEDGYYSDPSEGGIAEELAAKIDTLAFDGAISEQEAERIISSLNAIEARTNSIEGTLEDMSGR